MTLTEKRLVPNFQKKYGRHFNFYNINCSKLAARIIEKTGCPIPSNNENEKRWPALFTGRYVDKNTDNVEGEFIWKLRPDLKSALEQMDLTEYPLYETENSNIRFWVFNHTWTDASDENVKDLVNQALENNYAFMQYEYKYQDSKRVTENYRMAAEIKSGDYVFLRGKNHIYAYGKVITPRLNATQLLNLRKIINENSCP